MGFVRSLATLLFIVAIPVALVTTNIRILYNSSAFFTWEFDRQHVSARTGLPESDVRRAGAAIRDYVNSNEQNLYVPLVVDGRETSFFNPQETAHMRDVKDLVRLSYRVEEIAVLYVLTYVVAVFIWAREESLRGLAGQLVAASLTTFAFLVATGLFATAGFNSAFDWFHRIFFPHGGWQFNPATDRLVQLFPPEFWQESTILLAAMTVVEAALLLGAAVACMAVTRRSLVAVFRPTSQHA